MTLPIVYGYPGARWDIVIGRHRLMMEAIAESQPVIFLNSPRFTGRLMEVKSPFLEKIHENLFIVHDAFGFRFSRLGRRLGRVSAKLDAVLIHSLLKSLGVKDYIYWLSAPSPEMLWGMNIKRLVYDCIDPCFTPQDQQVHDATEAAIVKLSRLVFCTAESLYEKLAQIHCNVHLLPNACQAPVHQMLRPALPKPYAAQGHSGPIIGYMGTFDSRVDTVMLTEAARRLPEYTFALPGRINADQEANVAELRKLPNVILPGSVSEQEGYAFTAAFDVGLVPFIPGPINDAINPVKMYMYLAAGKPVVATWLRECRRHAPYVYSAQSVTDFVEAIRRSIAEDSDVLREARIAFAMQNTWEDRARNALDHLRATGLLSDCITRQHITRATD